MHLSCPACAAVYEVAPGTLGPAGRHVQCSACATRWFAKAPPPPEPVSEDAIIARLEGRPRGGPAPAAAPGAAPRSAEVMAFRGPEPRTAEGKPGEAAAGPATEGSVAFDWLAPETEAAAPTETPLGAREPLAETAPAARPRLALDPARPEAKPARGVHRTRRRNRFWHGLAAGLVLVGLLFGVYRMAEDIAALAPPASDALAAYVDAVDEARLGIEETLGPAARSVADELRALGAP